MTARHIEIEEHGPASRTEMFPALTTARAPPRWLGLLAAVALFAFAIQVDAASRETL